MSSCTETTPYARVFRLFFAFFFLSIERLIFYIMFCYFSNVSCTNFLPIFTNVTGTAQYTRHIGKYTYTVWSSRDRNTHIHNITYRYRLCILYNILVYGYNKVPNLLYTGRIRQNASLEYQVQTLHATNTDRSLSHLFPFTTDDFYDAVLHTKNTFWIFLNFFKFSVFNVSLLTVQGYYVHYIILYKYNIHAYKSLTI